MRALFLPDLAAHFWSHDLAGHGPVGVVRHGLDSASYADSPERCSATASRNMFGAVGLVLARFSLRAGRDFPSGTGGRAALRLPRSHSG